MTCHAHALAASRMMLCKGDVDLIRETAAKLPEGAVVIDLGAGSGTSALALFAERRDIEVTTIDHDVANLDWAKLALFNAEVPLYRWRGILADSAFRKGDVAVRYGTAPVIPKGDIGLVIVDTSHEYADTLAEIEEWLPRLTPGGYMLFHDYDAEDAPHHYPGVKRAVDPFLEAGGLERVKRQGWSLLTRKPSEAPKASKAPAKPKRKATRKGNLDHLARTVPPNPPQPSTKGR